MKNLFKNLMLVAVAAMAFTACTETNEEVNAVSKVTRYEFTANIADDTRSGFAEKEEGAIAYKSKWFGDETLKIFVTDYNTYNVETTAPINAEGQFTLELENAPESFFVTVVSPADAWVSEYTANLPAEQTPLANSVDPKAHLLQSSPMPVSGGQATINLTHMAAYGKMTLKDVDFAIDHVVVDLKGSFYGYDREYSYTINATNVKNNTFWFATEPIDVAEFTVTAYDAEGNAVAKTVDVAEAGKTMSFSYGRVGTFSVSGLEAVVVPEPEPEPSVKTFTSANVAFDMSDEKYIAFNCDNGSLKKLQIDIANAFSDGNTILKEGTYSNVNPTQYGKIFTGTWSGSWYGEGEDMLYLTDITITVTHVAEGYHILFENVTEYYDEYTLIESATYTGTIDGLSTPDVSGEGGEGGEGGEVEEPEFVIPGEGGSYTYDFRYTKFYQGVGMNDSNALDVLTEDNLRWQIRFNSKLTSIEPGDYSAGTSAGFVDGALVVDTYNGGVEYAFNKWLYPDAYEKVTTFNVQKQGDIYCITMIASGGYNCPAGANYRCVYIGKLK